MNLKLTLFIRVFKIECLEILSAFLKQEKPSQPPSVTSFPQVLMSSRNPIAILSCWFVVGFNLRLLLKMIFNH